MNKTAIIDTVRKLLRLSGDKRATTHERAIAQTQAYALMEKHNLHIEHDDNENYRERVEGVAGVFWREQLLNNIARGNSCKLVRQTRGKTYDAVLVGYMSDVERTRNTYTSLSTKMVVDCCIRWKRFADDELRNVKYDSTYGGLTGYDDFDFGGIMGGGAASNFIKAKQRAQDQIDRINAVEKEFGDGKAFAAWARVYLNTASDAFGQKLVEPKVRAPQYAATPVAYGPREKEESNRDREIASILKDKEKLSKEFGAQLTERLQREAITYGRVFGSGAATVLQRPMPKCLTAASSWLPPPPPKTRFSELDIDDGVAVAAPAKPVGRKKVDLDLDVQPARAKAARELDFD
jgi:hypothetical protein